MISTPSLYMKPWHQSHTERRARSPESSLTIMFTDEYGTGVKQPDHRIKTLGNQPRC